MDRCRPTNRGHNHNLKYKLGLVRASETQGMLTLTNFRFVVATNTRSAPVSDDAVGALQAALEASQTMCIRLDDEVKSLQKQVHLAAV